MKTRFGLAILLAAASGAAIAADEASGPDWHLLQWGPQEIDYADLATRVGEPTERTMWIAIAKKTAGGVSREMVSYQFDCPKKSIAPIQRVVIGPDGKDVSSTDVAPVFAKPARGSRDAAFVALGCAEDVGQSVHAYFDEDLYDWAAKAMADPAMLSAALDDFRYRDLNGGMTVADMENMGNGSGNDMGMMAMNAEDAMAADSAMNAMDAAAQAAEAAANAADAASPN